MYKRIKWLTPPGGPQEAARAAAPGGPPEAIFFLVDLWPLGVIRSSSG